LKQILIIILVAVTLLVLCLKPASLDHVMLGGEVSRCIGFVRGLKIEVAAAMRMPLWTKGSPLTGQG
jgi:hypothetical protein